MRLHDEETAPTVGTVAALLAEQAPVLAAEQITALPTGGTVHHVFGVGRQHVARLPRIASWAHLAAEASVLARVADALPVAVPEVVLVGVPGAGFAHPWLLTRWLEGDPVVPADDPALAEDLAAVLSALHAVDPEGLPEAGRGALPDLDDATRAAIAATTELDRRALTAAWDRALDAPPWDGRRTTMHADLLPGNLLTTHGRLAAVIDWGSAGAGDAAHDLIPAWAVLRGAARERFRLLTGADDGAWSRARGLALTQSLLCIPYYRARFPAFAAMNVGTATEILADASVG